MREAAAMAAQGGTKYDASEREITSVIVIAIIYESFLKMEDLINLFEHFPSDFGTINLIGTTIYSHEKAAFCDRVKFVPKIERVE
jgi:hypothetical protein